MRYLVTYVSGRTRCSMNNVSSFFLYIHFFSYVHYCVSIPPPNICCCHCTSPIVLFLREATGLVKAPTRRYGLSAVNYSPAWVDLSSMRLCTACVLFCFPYCARSQSPRVTRVVLVHNTPRVCKKSWDFCREGNRRDEESLSFLCEGTEDWRRDGRYKINLYLELW